MSESGAWVPTHVLLTRFGNFMVLISYTTPPNVWCGTQFKWFSSFLYFIITTYFFIKNFKHWVKRKTIGENTCHTSLET